MMGRKLAQESPAEVDLVVPIPDSGVTAALGFSYESDVPFQVGLIRNHYVGRTFIEPRQSIRHFGVKIKLNPVRELLDGKRVVLVDDSIVRGTTTRAIVEMLRSAGAAEVHLRISSPPYRWPCFYGMDTGTQGELLAANLNMQEIRDYLGVDSIAYLELDRLIDATEAPGAGFCTACLDGQYPVEIPEGLTRNVLEERRDDRGTRFVSTSQMKLGQ